MSCTENILRYSIAGRVLIVLCHKNIITLVTFSKLAQTRLAVLLSTEQENPASCWCIVGSY